MPLLTTLLVAAWLRQRKTVPHAAGVLPVAASTGRMLLGKRALTSPAGGTWSCWGGRLEPTDRTPVAAALRELAEETGWRGSSRALLPLDVQHYPNLVYHHHLLVLDEEYRPHLNREHEAWRWVLPTALPTPLHPGLGRLLHTPETRALLTPWWPL